MTAATATATVPGTFFDLGAYVVTAAFIGGRGVFALGDGTVEVAEGPHAGRHRLHGGGLLAATASEDGASLVTGGDDGRVLRFTPGDAPVELAAIGRKWIDRVAAGPGGAVAFASGRTVWVRLDTGALRERQLARAAGGLGFAPKGLRLAIGRYDGATLWMPGTAAEPVELEWKGMHGDVTWSPDGRFVVTAMQENALHGWRVADAKHMRMTGYPAKVRSMSWSPKGRWLATGGAPAAILWPFQSKDGPMGKAPAELGPRDALAHRVACHPREDVVAIGYADGVVDRVRIADAAVVRLVEAGGGPISALAWSAAGDRLAFGSEDGRAGVLSLGA